MLDMFNKQVGRAGAGPGPSFNRTPAGLPAPLLSGSGPGAGGGHFAAGSSSMMPSHPNMLPTAVAQDFTSRFRWAAPWN